MNSQVDHSSTASLNTHTATNSSQAEQCLFCGALDDRRAALDPNAICKRCASPLFPTARQRLEPSGQRMLGRVEKHSPIRILTHWMSREELPAVMRNLSLNGMQLLSSAELDRDQLIRIDADFCQCVARVAHCRKWGERGWIIGIEFVTLRFSKLYGNFVSTQA
jgi:hypothetical protein